MTGIQDYEQQGARPREARPDDGVPVSPALRVLTWLGVAVIVAAVIVLALAVQPHRDPAGDATVDSTGIVAGVVLVCTGIVVVSVRVAAGAVIRALRPAPPQ